MSEQRWSGFTEAERKFLLDSCEGVPGDDPDYGLAERLFYELQDSFDETAPPLPGEQQRTARIDLAERLERLAADDARTLYEGDVADLREAASALRSPSPEADQTLPSTQGKRYRSASPEGQVDECPRCGGTGKVSIGLGRDAVCLRCEGTGYRLEPAPSNEGEGARVARAALSGEGEESR